MSQFLIKSIGNTINASSYISSRFAASKALQLFATPRKGRYSQAQKQIVASAEKNTLYFEDLNIAVYHWKGNNKTILLAHGWESNASRWDYLLEDLKAQDYNIIAMDAPVHGDSGGKLFNAILYADCIDVVAKAYNPEVILGHSVGGMATVFCLHNNEIDSVKKIVLLGAPAHFTGVFTRYKQMMGYNKRVSDSLEKILVERFGNASDYFSAANFTENLDCEGLIIHDKKDKIIPYEDALLFKDKFKNSQLITTKGFGHGLKDTSVTPQIIEFING